MPIELNRTTHTPLHDFLIFFGRPVSVVDASNKHAQHPFFFFSLFVFFLSDYQRAREILLPLCERLRRPQERGVSRGPGGSGLPLPR